VQITGRWYRDLKNHEFNMFESVDEDVFFASSGIQAATASTGGSVTSAVTKTGV